MHLRLKWDKVLLILVVHFACYDVSDIHYCGKRREVGVKTFSRPAECSVAMKEIQKTAWWATSGGKSCFSQCWDFL